MTNSPDIASPEQKARRPFAPPWTKRELAGRLLWACVAPIFRFSPRLMWGWRRCMLRAFGANIGPGVRIHPSVRIMIPWNLTIGARGVIGDRAILYALGPISIGANAMVSQNAHLCAGTHDYRCDGMPLLKLPIEIGCGAWVCADAFIGPGVCVGEYAIVGARAVAVRDVPAATVVVGNPAIAVRKRELPANNTSGRSVDAD
jgi:putative colanic acid biosynthesis acetyltransferase WcaF